ncbi:hypothetical protein Tdes44962_MAKER08616 [Teratosphaeria destructans]|uniref:Uncharacterized protein n=1 Tax=Teratosphaeria destructans TaxID=418781 RepID=A0A9W7SW86_9PEZI|nr:hypothetical protein Tdes44962_MAKER08616 [Teratosphaeria destructans]
MNDRNQQQIWHQCGHLATVLPSSHPESNPPHSSIQEHKSYVHPLDLRISAANSAASTQVSSCCNPTCCQSCINAIEEQHEGLLKHVNDLVRSGENIGPGEMERLTERLRMAGIVLKGEKERHMEC